VTGSDAQLAIAQATAILRKPIALEVLVEVVEQNVDRAA
jgi:hypothetical protein